MAKQFSQNALSTNVIVILALNLFVLAGVFWYAQSLLKAANEHAVQINQELTHPAAYLADTYRSQLMGHVQFEEASHKSGQEKIDRLKVFEHFFQKADESLAKFDEHAVPEELKPLVDSYRLHLRKYKDNYKNLMGAIETEDSDTIAVMIDEQIRPDGIAMGKVVDQLLVEYEKLTRREHQRGMDEYEQARMILAVVCLIGLGISFSVGLLTLRQMRQSLNRAQSTLRELAGGNFGKPIDTNAPAEIKKLLESLDDMRVSISDTVASVDTTVISVQEAATQMSAGNADLAQRTQTQASRLEETANTMKEMTATVRQNAADASRANELAGEASHRATAGGDVVNRAVMAMEELNESSARVVDIVTLIDEISFQTNLLALNAAVEAARAGDHGRGFAVVAGEVRNLAQRSAQAAQEIKGLIADSVEKVGASSELVNESGRTLNAILDSINEVSGFIGRIAVASDKQASGIEAVNASISDMEKVTQANASLVEEAAVSSEELHNLSQQLHQQVAYFEIRRNGAQHNSGTAARRDLPPPQYNESFAFSGTS